MELSIQGWVFDVDVKATVDYSVELFSDHCECGYCRNYYTAVSDSYPALQPFLSQFGIHIEGPVDFLPIEPTLCMVSYAVCGRIIKHGNSLIELNGVTVSVQEANELDYELSCSSPYFVLTTNALVLPWLLDEDMNEVVSPANEPECLERMWKKLLGSAQFTGYQS